MGELLSYEDWVAVHSREVEDLRRAIEHDRNVPYACDKIFNAVRSFMGHESEIADSAAAKAITSAANDIVKHEARQVFIERGRKNPNIEKGVSEAFSWAGNSNAWQEMANISAELAVS